jgi:uncharacterized repeat protein (TIGR01451 family)
VGGLRSVVRSCGLRWLTAGLVVVSLAAFALAGSGAKAATVCRGSCVDLSVSVSDGVAAVVPGGAAIYLVTVRNAGPSSINSLSLTDTTPPAFRNVVYAPASGSYKASTHLWSGLSLGSGRSTTMLVAGTTDPAATGTFVNSLTVAPPAGTTETSAANNTATDTDTLTGLADLSVGLSDGVTSLVAGRSTVYTVTVRNNGLSTVSSLLLTDTAPSSLTGLAFTPASGSYSATTHLWSALTLAAGQSVTMTVTGTVAPTATGSLLNTATVAPPAGVIDPISGNNSTSDTDKLTAQADLSIINSDGATTAAPGSPTTYTVVVSDPGPSTATGATVSDTLPAGVSSDTWTGPNGTSGTGNLHATVTVPAGGTASYTIHAAVSATATGSLVDTATVTAPAGLTDPNSANNGATDTDTLVPQTDLSVSNSDGVTSLVPGSTTSYTIVVANHGPLTATGAVVADNPPPAVTADSWSGTNGTSGSGPIHATVTLAAGNSVTYTLVATVDPAANGSLIDTATVNAPAGLSDPNPANNTAADSDSLTPTGDLQISNSDGTTTSVSAGGSTSYSVAVTNTGPSTVAGATVANPIPAGVDSFSWTGSDGSSGAGAIDTTVTLAPAATITYTVSAAVDSSATGSINDTATVTAPAGFADPNPANNSETDSDTVTPAGITVTGRVKLGDLYLCNLSSLTREGNDGANVPLDVSDMEGHTVRELLPIVEQKLGGGAITDSFADLDALTTDAEIAFENGVPLSFFADGHLSTRQDCTPVNWQPNQIISYGQADFVPSIGGPEPSGVLDYLFENLFAGPTVFELVVGDTADPGGYTLSFASPGDITNFFPTGGPPGALTDTFFDPDSHEVDQTAGVFGGDVVALALDVAFSDSYAPRTCSPPGSANSNGAIMGIPCAWGLDDMLTFGQFAWSGNPLSLLDSFGTVEKNGLLVGDPAGNHIELTDSDAVRGFLPTGGPTAALSGSFQDPTHNQTGTGGVFGGDVVGLQLDVDYADAGLLPRNAGLNFAGLTLCNVPGFPELTGKTVSQVLTIANTVLAGESTVYTAAEFDPLTSNLETAFADTLPQPTASYLYNGSCPNSGTEAP